MEHDGKYFVPEGDPDNFGETLRFVHTKYPEYRVIIESRVPYRDAQGFARGVKNPESSLTICFKGRMFETNSARAIEALRTQVRGFIGKKGPVEIQDIIGAGKRGGFFEVDKVEEAVSLRRAELEAQARVEIQAELAAEEEMEEMEVVKPTAEEVKEIVEAKWDDTPRTTAPTPVAGEIPISECANCGTLCRGKFCAECGYSLVPRAKRQWVCDDCGEVFDSGFKLGNHKDECPAVERAVKPMVESKQMIAGAGTDAIGSKKLQGLL